MHKIFLIDVSGYLYRAYFALPPMSNDRGEPTQALFGFVRSILRLIKDFSPTHVAAVFDGPEGKRSRTEIFADYKIHRKPIPHDLPQQIARAAEFCELEGIPQITLTGVEADDAMGSIAKWASEQGATVYLCTSDKNLAPIVDDKVLLLNTHKDNLIIDKAKVEEIYGVRPDQIVDLLALMGDASDNIPGLPGFGAKTAASLLQEFGSLETLLANPEKVSGKKKQETLRDEAELARLSQQLALINCDLPIPQHPSDYLKREANLEGLKAFFQEMNFASLSKEVALRPVQEAVREEPTREPPATKISYEIIDSEEALKEVVARLSAFDEICIDTETTGLRPLLAELVGIGLGHDASSAWYIPMNGELGRERAIALLQPLFKRPKIAFYGHNIKYDVHVLAKAGLPIKRISFDTMVASFLLNSHHRNHSLDALALSTFQLVMTPIKALIGEGRRATTMDLVPIESVASYCAEDVTTTSRLRADLEQGLKERPNLLRVFETIELPLLPVLIDMERTGIFVDRNHLARLSSYFTSKIETLREEIFTLAGTPFDLNSPKQLSRILFEDLGIKATKKTAKGSSYSTGAEVLELLKFDFPIAGKVLDYRTLEKLRSTYVDSLPNEINPQTGRVHCTFNQSVAATGRLSCQDPNLQNIPVRSEEGRKIREAFRPHASSDEPPWLFVSADYSQIELRLLAHLSGDPALIDAFEQGEDIHASTAAKIFDIPLARVTKEQRASAKAVNFGIIYGQQAFGLSRQIGISHKEAAQFIETYLARYPKVQEYIEYCKRVARETGRATTISGRERLIPDINSSNGSMRIAAERLAINSPLQGSAADLIKTAMIRVAELLHSQAFRARLLLQIHDELLFELPESEVSTFIPPLREAMEKAFELSVATPVDIVVGKNWKEC